MRNVRLHSIKGAVRMEIMKADWALIWGGSRGTRPCVFPCKVAAAGNERYLVCAAGAAWIVSTRNRSLLCVLQRVVLQRSSCVHDSIRLLTLWLQIAVQWLRQGCLAPRLRATFVFRSWTS